MRVCRSCLGLLLFRRSPAHACLLLIDVCEVVFDALAASGNWFYAVGSTDKWGAGIPGASDAETQVELYVWCAGLYARM